MKLLIISIAHDSEVFLDKLLDDHISPMLL